MLEIKTNEKLNGPKILVIGVGGGGNNAVNRMIEAELKEIEFAVVNTDVAVLDNNKAERRIQIGAKLLKGYGAGADPAMGEAAALEDEERIKELIAGYDMVIVTCGMGGGTGTGAAPIIAKCCKDEGILTVGVVTLPFSFESGPRMTAAKAGTQALKAQVDTLLVIPNDKLIGLSEKPLMLEDAFLLADSVLKYAIEGISNIVYNRGTVNIDFNDVKTTLKNKGLGHLGVGSVSADGSVLEAVKKAVNSPLLTTSIEGAANILINIGGRVDIFSLNEAVGYIRELAGERVNIIWGTVTGESNAEDKIIVTLIATGMPEVQEEKLKSEKKGDYKQIEIRKMPPLNTPIQKGVSTMKVEMPQPKKQKEIYVPSFLSKYN